MAYAYDDLAELLKKHKLTYTSEDAENGFTRKKRGKGFSYHHINGNAIKDNKILSRLRRIGVPPAYTDVWYCEAADGHLQATATDGSGNRQYFYHLVWEECRDDCKFEQMKILAKVLPRLRKRVQTYLTASEDEKYVLCAAVVRIIDQTGLRVGSAKAAAQHKTYGISTLRREHVKLNVDTIELKFRGKAGMPASCLISDAAIHSILKKSVQKRGARPDLFHYKGQDGKIHVICAHEVNAFMKEQVKEAISAKDLRTWRSNCLFAQYLFSHYRSGGKVIIKDVLKEVAGHLCNTPSVLKKNYIHPDFIELAHNFNQDHMTSANFKGPKGLNKFERYTLNTVFR